MVLVRCSSRLNGGGFVNIFIGQMPRKKFYHIQQIVQIDYNSLNTLASCLLLSVTQRIMGPLNMLRFQNIYSEVNVAPCHGRTLR